MNSPFKFLDSYTKEDRHLFFGRERETEELYQKVFESKIMLVYGVSGTGKSSLIHCGLAGKFSDSDWLPVNVRRGRDINESLRVAVERGLQPETINPDPTSQVCPPTDLQVTPRKQDKLPPKPETKLVPLKKLLKNLYLDHFKPVFLIFDQFEELFIFGSRSEKEEFIKSVKTIVESDLQVRFMFVIREEYLAGITEFEKQIPTILTNRVRIEKMTRVNAQQAIEGPCKYANIEVEQGFPELLLDKLAPEGREVELTYLQVYLDKVYRTAITRLPSLRGGTTKQPLTEGGLSFTLDLLNELGDVKDLLGSFLEEQISQLPDPDTALVVLKAFVSAKGTKRQVTEDDVLDYSRTLGKNISSETLKELILRFVNLRILRDKDDSGRYELRHDALAAKIYEKITLVEKELIEIRQFIENAHENYKRRKVFLSGSDLSYIAPYEDKMYLSGDLQQFLEESKRNIHKAKRRKRNLAFAAVLFLLVIMTSFTWWAMRERGKAEIELARSTNNMGLICLEKAEQAIAERDLNAIRLYSLYAYKYLDDSLKHKALTNIISYSYLPIEYSIKTNRFHDGQISNAIFSENDKYFITASLDLSIKLWDVKTGDLTQTINKHSGYINDMDCEGDLLISGSSDASVLLCQIPEGKVVNEYQFESSVKRVQFIDQTNYFYALTDSNYVYICSRNTNKYIKLLEKVESIEYVKNGEFIYTKKGSDKVYKRNILENTVKEIYVIPNSYRILKIKVIDRDLKVIFQLYKYDNEKFTESNVIHICKTVNTKGKLKCIEEINSTYFNTSENGSRMMYIDKNSCYILRSLKENKSDTLPLQKTYNLFAFQNKGDIVFALNRISFSFASYDLIKRSVSEDMQVLSGFRYIFSNNENSFLILLGDNDIWVYNTHTGKIQNNFRLISNKFHFNKNENIFIFENLKGRFELWDLKSNKKINELTLPDGNINEVYYCNGKILYYSSSNSIYYFSVVDIFNTKDVLLRIPSSTYLSLLCISTDQKYGAVEIGSEKVSDKGIYVIDLDKMQVIYRISDYINQGYLQNIFIPNSNTLFIKTMTSINVYDLQSGVLKMTFDNNAEDIDVISVLKDKFITYSRTSFNYTVYLLDDASIYSQWGGDRKKVNVRDYDPDFHILQPDMNKININKNKYKIGSLSYNFNTWEGEIINSKDRIIIANPNEILSYSLNQVHEKIFDDVGLMDFNKEKGLFAFYNKRRKVVEVWDVISFIKIIEFPLQKVDVFSTLTSLKLNDEGNKIAFSYSVFPIQVVDFSTPTITYSQISNHTEFAVEFLLKRIKKDKKSTLIRDKTNFLKVINKPEKKEEHSYIVYFTDVYLNNFSSDILEYRYYMSLTINGFEESMSFINSYNLKDKYYSRTTKANELIIKDKRFFFRYNDTEVYDKKTNNLLKRFRFNLKNFQGIISPDSSRIVIKEAKSINLLEIETLKENILFESKDMISGYEINKDFSKIFIATHNGCLFVYDLNTGMQEYVYRGLGTSPEIYLTKDEKMLLVKAVDMVRLINLEVVKSKLVFDVNSEIQQLEENLRCRLKGIDLIPDDKTTPNLYKVNE